MMIRFEDGWSPELSEPLLEELRPGAAVEVEGELVTATTVLVVRTAVTVLLPLTVTTVVIICWVLLLTGNVEVTNTCCEVTASGDDCCSVETGAAEVDGDASGTVEEPWVEIGEGSDVEIASVPAEELG